jgi:hypothetical protein
MACQPVVNANGFDSPVLLRQQQELAQHIREIEDAKSLVIGIPSSEATAKLRRDFEAIMPLLDKATRYINGGMLDNMSDDELRNFVVPLKDWDKQMGEILEGATAIGLQGIEPFPKLLAEFKQYQERIQSQVEGIYLSLNDAFRDLMEKSGQDINVNG